jgi:ABC-type polysaccharide transport system permease subunit
MGASIYKNKKPAIIFLIPAFLFMIVYLYTRSYRISGIVFRIYDSWEAAVKDSWIPGTATM